MGIRVSSVSVITAVRRGQRGSLLRWRIRVTGAKHIREKWHYWFADHDDAIAVRDAMRRGETFEVALALVRAQARAG